MASILCLTGPAGPGKRAVVEGLAAELQRSGLRVGIIVQGGNAPEQGPVRLSLDGRNMVLQRNLERELSLEELAALYLDDLDLVITEMHDQARGAKVAFSPDGDKPDALPGLRAVVSRQPGDDTLPRFAPEDLSGLAQFVRQGLAERRPPAQVRLLVGGQRVPAKGFIQDMVAGTMRGLVGSLKGGDRPGPMIIFIQ